MNDVRQLNTKFSISEVTPFNKEFSYCKIYALYSGLNRNNSSISEEVINKTIESKNIFNIPIVGEYLERYDNFGDHGGKVVTSKDGSLEYVQTTRAYGLVPESAEITWEDITEEDGSIHRYLVIDRAILWTSRFKEISDLLEQPYGQSMEIIVTEGEFVDMNGTKTLEVQEFEWSALCILGVEKNGMDKVDPCFESSSIVGYSLDKEKFKSDFAFMVSEFKSSLITENTDHSTDTNSNSDNQDNSLDFTNINNKENDVVKTKTEIATNFALTIMQLYDEMNRVIEQQTFIGENWWGEKCEKARYYMRDFDEAYVYVIDVQNDYIDVKLPYSKEGDDIKVDFDSPTRVKYTPTDWEAQALEEEEMSFNYIKEYTKKTKSTIVEKVSEYDLKIKEHEDTVFAVENKYSELEKQFVSQSDIVSEKDKTIEQLNEQVQSFAQKEDEKAVEDLLKNFTAILSEEEKLEFKTKRSEFDSIEKFEIHIKSFAFDKIKNQSKDENKSFITMALIDDVKEEKKELSHWDRMKEKSGK